MTRANAPAFILRMHSTGDPRPANFSSAIMGSIYPPRRLGRHLPPLVMRRLGLFAVLLSAAACRERPKTDPQLFAQWTKYLYGAVRAERLSPPVASRLY